MICKRLAWARSARNGGETPDPAPVRNATKTGGRVETQKAGRSRCRVSSFAPDAAFAWLRLKRFRLFAYAGRALAAIYLIAIKRDSLSSVHLGMGFEPIAQGVVQPRLPARTGFLEGAHNVGIQSNVDGCFWGVSAGLA